MSRWDFSILVQLNHTRSAAFEREICCQELFERSIDRGTLGLTPHTEISYSGVIRSKELHTTVRDEAFQFGNIEAQCESRTSAMNCAQ